MDDHVGALYAFHPHFKPFVDRSITQNEYSVIYREWEHVWI